MNGIHLSLVGLNLSIVGGFWMIFTLFNTVGTISILHHILIWGGLILSLVSLLLPPNRGEKK